jgi:hypothetical protein
MPAKEFLDGLFTQNAEEASQVLALFIRTADHGAEFHNDRKFKQLQDADGICEFKGNKYRVFAFQDGRDWVLTHGCRKPKSNAAYRREIGTAHTIREEHRSGKTGASQAGDSRGREEEHI